MSTPEKNWEFWIDRGGTFTDIVAKTPTGEIKTHKMLSENPERYKDAAVAGIRYFLGVSDQDDIPAEKIDAIKMGTTVGTNALLERKGDKTVLVMTKGLRDQLRIGYQNRPKLFVQNIELPEMLYCDVIEADERMSAHGDVVRPIDESKLRADLQKAYNSGIRGCAIAFMHGYRYQDHEKKAGEIARDIGFTQISISHQVSPLMKLVGRGDTTVVDAYLSPILRRYVDQVTTAVGDVRLMFMQSNGGLTRAEDFQGRDCILSGPAGGIVGAAQTSKLAGFDRMIGFDMGGTSTDVTHYAGEYERSFETVVAGVRLRAPMMNIHTVAAGGGSVCHFSGGRYRVGPESAGANPGPAAYRRGGPLTVTDCNVMLGKLRPEFFPHIFGPDADQALDKNIVAQKFETLAKQIANETGSKRTPAEVAAGFLEIAVLNMARAIKKISVERGYDVSTYTMNCFGGAGGQHACLVADALGMTKIMIHPHAGVLSAYGMGLADTRIMSERAAEKPLSEHAVDHIQNEIAPTLKKHFSQLQDQGFKDEHIEHDVKLMIRYAGSDKPLNIEIGTAKEVKTRFEGAYQRQYGFIMQGKDLIIEAVSIETIGQTGEGTEQKSEAPDTSKPAPQEIVEVYMAGADHKTAVFERENLKSGQRIMGPALVLEATGTNVIEPGWQAEVNAYNHLILTRIEALPKRHAVGTDADPLMLEVFNNLFMSIAEQMGTVLENTAYSVNIKERLDFSCAIFDIKGGLIANAPHMPVHLGSMGESIRAIMSAYDGRMKKGDVYMLNDPYDGGTHLPDITVVTPVFDQGGTDVLFYVASRGHHADVGGISAGSMPPNSKTIQDEGVRITNFKMVDQGRFLEDETRALLSDNPNPARNIDQNIADLQAQIAANEKGVTELHSMCKKFGLDTVNRYMGYVQDNAEEQVRRAITHLKDGSFEQRLDNGSVVKVDIKIDTNSRSAIIDFTGTSEQQPNNFNAPSSICRAAVLYVFRTLVEDDIPMNEGCLKPVKIILPQGSMLNPMPPAAVVAGNVEVSQAVTNALYGALGVMAASQGTMNNFTFGNDSYQYYETICGGSGAGQGFGGTDAVQTHMTNSRMTDPEILEWRFPVRLEEFSIREGSGGTGKYKGGNGVVRKIRFLEPMTANILSNNRTVAPYGMHGGGDGKTGENSIVRADGQTQELAATADAQMNIDDLFIIETPGGGGYGD